MKLKNILHESIDMLNAKNANALYYIIDYVYSFGNQRYTALNKLHANSNQIVSSNLVYKLPINLNVSRWFDITNPLFNNGILKLNYYPVSYSILKPHNLHKIFNKSYGFIIEKNLRNLNGHFIVVHDIINKMQKTNFIETILMNDKHRYDFRSLIELIYELGIIDKIPSNQFDKVRINKEELPFKEQKEILILSKSTNVIYEEEIEIDLNESMRHK